MPRRLLGSALVLVECTKSQLDTVVLSTGQLIFCTDTSEIFFDSQDFGRVEYTREIIKVNTEDARMALIAPIADKLYFVRSTNILYRYDGENWNRVGVNKTTYRTILQNFVNSYDDNETSITFTNINGVCYVSGNVKYTGTEPTADITIPDDCKPDMKRYIDLNRDVYAKISDNTIQLNNLSQDMILRFTISYPTA